MAAIKPVVVRNVAIGEGIPKIAVPIAGRTKADILAEAEKLRDFPVDIAEWRADGFEDILTWGQAAACVGELREALGQTPLLFTFRTAKEGGEKEIPVEIYEKLNLFMAQSGCVDLIDVEALTGDGAVKRMIEGAHAAGAKVVASSHDFRKTPGKDAIISRLCRMQESGADILKIAVMPRSRKDVLTLLSATEEMYTQYAKCPLITMSMAGTGMVSRLAGEVFGSAVTFGSVGRTSAPGQIGVGRLDAVLRTIHESMEGTA